MNANLSSIFKVRDFEKETEKDCLQYSVPSRVRNLREMRNFWANFTDFEPEVNTIKCKTEKLMNILMQECSLYLGKANLMQKICKRSPQSSEIFGQKFQ